MKKSTYLLIAVMVFIITVSGAVFANDDSQTADGNRLGYVWRAYG